MTLQTTIIRFQARSIKEILLQTAGTYLRIRKHTIFVRRNAKLNRWVKWKQLQINLELKLVWPLNWSIASGKVSHFYDQRKFIVSSNRFEIKDDCNTRHVFWGCNRSNTWGNILSMKNSKFNTYKLYFHNHQILICFNFFTCRYFV